MLNPVTNQEVTPRAKAVSGKSGAMQVQNVAFSPVASQGRENDLSGVVSLTPPPGANVIRLPLLGAFVRMTITNAVATALPSPTEGFHLRPWEIPIELLVEPGDTLNFIGENPGAGLEYQWGKTA